MLRSRGESSGRFQRSPRSAPLVYFSRAGETIWRSLVSMARLLTGFDMFWLVCATACEVSAKVMIDAASRFILPSETLFWEGTSLRQAMVEAVRARETRPANVIQPREG